MVRVITQETYDEVVNENIEEFDMTAEEAIKEATEQFKAQGVDLSNIIKDLALSPKGEDVVSAVANLKNLTHSQNDNDIIKTMEYVKKECKKDIARKVRAAKDGAYTSILDILLPRHEEYLKSKSKGNEDVIICCLETLIALMDGQPDLLEVRGAGVIKSNIQNVNEDSVLVPTLKWASTCCVMHEMNRQNVFKNILHDLNQLIKNKTSYKVRSETLQLIRNLTLDDDVRVEFGKAHEHAREMGYLMLDTLGNMLKETTKPPLVSEVMLTAACLLVRNELCAALATSVDDLIAILSENYDNIGVVQQCYKLITALAGNDDVKRKLVSTGLPPILISLLNRHSNNPTATALSLKCIAALSLRETTHGIMFLENGAPEAIVACMNVNKDSASVQKHACWAIRNMVARCRDFNVKFHELGIQEILNDLLNKYDEAFGYDVKSALRDLECDVKFNEQWTGKGVELDQ